MTGLSDAQLRAVRAADLTTSSGRGCFASPSANTAPGMLGSYAVTGSALRFTPQFALDPGRPYSVRFDPAQLPGAGDAAASPLIATISVPAKHRAASTIVARVYPSGEDSA